MDDLKPQRKPKSLPLSTILGITFGIFMVIVYVGMGYLLMTDFFPMITESRIAWLRWFMGPILVIYGIYRGWRQYKLYTQIFNQDDDDE
ncbi:MAG: hypothetical protein ACI31C_05675 [Muribaculaceae bacterium]